MSTIKVDTIQDTSGNERFTAFSWVNFNGTGTVAIRESGGLSSITDNAAGDFSMNFSSAAASANYVTFETAGKADTVNNVFTYMRNVYGSGPTTTVSRFTFPSNAGTFTDREHHHAMCVN